MKATETPFVTFMRTTAQFRIPIFQRTYSWEQTQCKRLWDDILREAKNESKSGHFIGSIVSTAQGLHEVTSIPQFLIIDGQQRLTTLLLLFTALGKIMEERKIDGEINQRKINNYFLFNREEEGEQHYKLILTKSDRDTLIDITEGRTPKDEFSETIMENYNFFLDRIQKTDVDLKQIYKGISKLTIVSITLDNTSDNPQLIFESLNSTGLKLTQADLIRNYVLMGLKENDQKDIYKNYWFPMEQRFVKTKKLTYFDKFMRYYLTLKTGQLVNIDDVYESFKRFWEPVKESPLKEAMEDITKFSKYFSNLISAKFEDDDINRNVKDINTLKMDVAYPFLLQVFDDYYNNIITKNDVLEILFLVESYVFRRAICEVPPNSLNKTFPAFTKEIEKENYLESLKAAFIHRTSYLRFPDDVEFRREFQVKNVYNFRSTDYLLDKLENYDRKELVNTDEYTTEHIMPQNPNLSIEWRKELGENWQQVHNDYLHVIGNLTKTGYNSELSDKPFLEKRDMKGGFVNSPLLLNHDYLATLEHWNEDEIKKRGHKLTELAIKIWPAPHLSQEILSKYQKIEVPDDDEEDEDEEKDTWTNRFNNANYDVQENINTLKAKIKQQFDCLDESYLIQYYFYLEEPFRDRNTFAVLQCGKSISHVCFRINPDTFNYDDPQIRTVKGWFFPTHNERRIAITNDNIEKIMKYLEHAYNYTKEFSEMRFTKHSKVAKKAADTKAKNQEK